MLIVSAIPKGTPSHPRYILSNQIGLFWDGKEWGEEKSAMLYTDFNEVGRVCSELLEQQMTGKPVRHFVVPCGIKVCGDTEIDVEQMRLWLMKAARLYVDLKYGPGPGDDTVAFLSIDWLDLEEKKQ